jgi:hypothetical protein
MCAATLEAVVERVDNRANPVRTAKSAAPVVHSRANLSLRPEGN